MLLSPLILIALAAGVVVLLVNNIRTRFYHARKARELGCEPPVRNLRSDPSGVYGLILSLRADREKRFLQMIQEDVQKIEDKRGRVVGTFVAANAFFRDVKLTTDPQNIQAMLALKFKEFSLGENRIHNFEPLLGNGIVRLYPFPRSLAAYNAHSHVSISPILTCHSLRPMESNENILAASSALSSSAVRSAI